jgi:NAD-dependent SIR2 family protein deacetylase
MKDKPIDCIKTDNLTCPHCGHVFDDSREVFLWNDMDSLLWASTLPLCPTCGKEFYAWRKLLYWSIKDAPVWNEKGEPEEPTP